MTPLRMMFSRPISKHTTTTRQTKSWNVAGFIPRRSSIALRRPARHADGDTVRIVHDHGLASRRNCRVVR